MLAERHVRHLANEHKLCETPANKCTLTLRPFELILGGTSLERRCSCSLYEPDLLEIFDREVDGLTSR